MNRSRHEVRILNSRPYSPEQACFPAVAQIAKLYRKTTGRRKEIVYVMTSREQDLFDAKAWLTAQRQYWGIENGLHQRLDASAHEDCSRIRTINSIWVSGMFRRLGVSIYAEWISRSQTRRRVSLHRFHKFMAQNNNRHAFILVSAQSPSLRGKFMK